MSNRRDFLKTLAAGGLLLAVGPGIVASAADAPAAEVAPPPGWVRIAPDGSVTILSNTSEIGQGTGTAIAQMLADEMDLDWKTVRIDMAPVEKQFINPGWGEYATYGSGGVARQFQQLRKAGAQARAMLVAAAAAQWKVPAAECDTQLGAVLHQATGRKLPYAKLVQQAALQPVPAEPPLMPKERWRHMGKDVARLDLPAKTDGSAVYGIDVKMPGMLHAAILQCPHFGGKLAAVDAQPALARRGVKKVVRLPDAVAVVADSYWRAQQALNALKPEWDLAAASKHSSAPYRDMLREAVRKDGDLVVPRNGKAEDLNAAHDAGAAKASAWIERTYSVPLLAHATMEPMNGTASVMDGKAQLWLPTQAQDTARTYVSQALGIAPEAVTIHTTLSGGGFGRRIEADFAVQAALIARDAGVPVKLLWSREEDMRHGYHRPAAVLRLRAGFDAAGAVTAVRMDSASDTLFSYSRFGADKQYAKPFDRSAVGVLLTRYYGLPGFVHRTNTVDAGVPLGYWRSVAASQNIFATESFVDELALRAKRDPLDYRRSLMKPGSRERAVLDQLEARSGWHGKGPAGRHRGMAFTWANGTYIGQVVELSVDAESRVKLHRVTTVLDCGITVNPRNVRGQIEGGVIFALSAAIYGEITVKDGAVEQSNFTDYKLLALAETPALEVVIIDSNEAPGGVGEEAVGPLAPALANALFAATGKRYTDLPLIKAGLRLQ
ncbi:isoquinoline 1-oxidoreductase, beta subunit [Duganella sp. CF458]|uniref:xanthine dehydrogenase family protein molybdopterin-binding subunit n=1 Tax=Duganella sp. CF458 TaxID=1884368 RepID=UPI0008EF9D25|nr:molybdopterin cofactor-binding domain-containing protein [Duganella sp. CF458]SFF54756.1 isoquinoline 1-oxidoreductase, beta subunit [Duganella sp. CF458]